MDIKRLFTTIAFRTLLIAPIVVGLCFIYPPALGMFVGAGVLTLGTSIAFSVKKCKINSYFDDIPRGDLEYYELPKESVYEKIETKVLNSVENKMKNQINKNKNSDNEETLSR